MNGVGTPPDFYEQKESQIVLVSAVGSCGTGKKSCVAMTERKSFYVTSPKFLSIPDGLILVAIF